jgi:hypothetical protein
MESLQGNILSDFLSSQKVSLEIYEIFRICQQILHGMIFLNQLEIS